jgi:hypothetical protein
VGPTDGIQPAESAERKDMAFKPNYNFERRERERAKAAKKAARLQAKRDKSEKNKTEDGDVPSEDTKPDEETA